MADSKSFFGAFALSSATVAKLAIQVFVLPLLARILGPSAYGVVGMALPFILFANMLCDGGLAAALARMPTASRELESTIFWISLSASVGASLLLCAIAQPLAQVLRQPGLAPVLASLTGVLVLSAALSVANSRITRSRRFVLFAIGEVAASLLGVVVAIAAALRGFGAWSLVFQQLAYWMIKALWLFPASGFRPTRQFNLHAAAPHLRFGVHMVGANLGDFVSKNLPIVIIAGVLGSAAGGRYALASQLGRLPELLIAAPLFLPIFTAAARAQAEGASLTPAVNRMLRMAITVLAPLYCGWAMIADIALRLFLGPKWQGTDILLRIIVPASFLVCLFMLVAAVLQGVGRSDTQSRLSFGLAASIGGGAALGAAFGAEGAVVGISAGTVVLVPFYLQALRRQLRVSASELLGGCLPPMAATALMGLALMLLRETTVGLEDWPRLAVLVLSGVAVYAAGLLPLSRGRLWEDLRALRPARLARA
jgi:O-antigen/teichoic acid export membrane protein